jgi:Protein of unknown function (DUF4058)
MASPFPGMNPYLESPDLWTEVHHRLISAIAAAIEPNLPPNYRVAIEKRVYSQTPDDSVLVGIPDVAVLSRRAGMELPTAILVAEPQVESRAITITLPMPEEVRESYLEIRDMAQGDVITSIEVLSPTNKRVGKGRDAYLAKREDVLGSATHLIELDLLREGLPFVSLDFLPRSAYRILVSRSERRPQAELYPVGLRQGLPTIAIPLQSGDGMPLLPLQALLLTLYDQARYDLAIDYQRDPVPGLKGDDLIWCGELLRLAGRREV